MDNKKYRDGSVRVFGFRSGKSYKMIPAIMYYIIAALLIVPSIFGEFKYFNFDAVDYPLVIIKYIFLIIAMYSPIIFLSDFDYVYKLPLFRKKQFGTSLLGILLVTAFCYFMVNVEIYAASANYKESRTVYYIENTRESVVLDKKKQDSDTITGKLYKIREASYYQVQVAFDKKGKDLSFDSNIKTDKIKIKDAKFKNAKTLYVRVRAFYKHNKKSYHGKWSDYTKVTVK